MSAVAGRNWSSECIFPGGKGLEGTQGITRRIQAEQFSPWQGASMQTIGGAGIDFEPYNMPNKLTVNWRSRQKTLHVILCSSTPGYCSASESSQTARGTS